MAVIEGMGPEGPGVAGVGGAPRLRSAAGRARERFDVEQPDAAAPSSVGEVRLGSLGSMLAVQEAEADAVQDREARRDGEGLLGELAALQRDLLGAGASAGGLARLAGLAAQARPAADRGLRGVLDAIGLRARVELARYAGGAQQSQG